MLILFRLIGLNKKRCIEKLEYKIVKYAYIIILTLSFLMGGILTSFSIPVMLLMLFVLNAVWGLLVLVLCVIPLKSTAQVPARRIIQILKRITVERQDDAVEQFNKLWENSMKFLE